MSKCTRGVGGGSSARPPTPHPAHQFSEPLVEAVRPPVRPRPEGGAPDAVRDAPAAPRRRGEGAQRDEGAHRVRRRAAAPPEAEAAVAPVRVPPPGRRPRAAHDDAHLPRPP
eukprot:gene6002-biopygen7064